MSQAQARPDATRRGPTRVVETRVVVASRLVAPTEFDIGGFEILKTRFLQFPTSVFLALSSSKSPRSDQAVQHESRSW